jgi:hypothetical protein
MSFTPNIPNTGQSLGQTKVAIQNNFTNYNTVMSVDHVAPNDTGQGKHKHSTYVAQSSDPVNLSGEISTYSKAISGVTEQFVIRDAVTTAIQMTRGTPSLGTSGRTFLPGGLLLQWGQGSSGTTINFTFSTPFNNPPYSLQVTPLANSTSGNAAVISIGSVTSSGFSALVSRSGLFVYYIAIGV